MTASSAMPRAGRLDCLCEPIEAADGTPDRGGTALLALAFAFSVVSQILTLTLLPLAGLSLAPSGTWATLPYASFYAGAALASLPASLLLDAFGRRAALSLGAGLGVAGGLLTVWSLLQWQFNSLVLGAFWLGIANGFSLFYRHAAAPLGARGTGSILLVFGAATFAGFLAPSLATIAERLVNPHALVGMAGAAALAHVGALLATAALPYRRNRRLAAETAASSVWQRLLWPSLLGGLGWFVMTAMMGATPIAMAGCGLEDAVPGVIAWHVIAMYAPSLALAGLPKNVRPSWIALAGCSLIAGAALVFLLSAATASFTLSAALLGIGWSLVTMGTTLWIHENGEPSRLLFGLHDAILLGSALLGALTAGFAP